MSLKDKKNIEELFRSSFEEFEVPVSDTMWSNISSQMGSGSSMASGAATGSKLLTYLGLSGAACVVGIVATLIYVNLSEENTVSNATIETSIEEVENTSEDDETLTEITNETDFDVAPAGLDDRNMVEGITQVNNDHQDPAITVNTEKPKKNVVVVKEEKVVTPYANSWINQLLTPKKKPYTEPGSNTNNTVANEISGVTPVIAEVSHDEIVASIVAAPVGGYAPLEVSFSHFSENGKVTWDFGDGSSSNDNKPTHVFDKYGKYTVSLTIEDGQGNVYQDFRVIEVLANSAITNIPNVFTPNNDGVNDHYKVEGKNIKEFSMAILNTKGEILYQSNSINDSWDGKDKFGDDLPIGTYVVVISARGIDGKKYENTGTVTLTR